MINLWLNEKNTITSFFENWIHVVLLVKTWVPFTQGCSMPSRLKLACSESGEDYFKTSVMYFRYFDIITSWKRAWTWTTLKSLHPIASMVCARFSQKLTQWFWRRFFTFSPIFSLFRYLSPFEKGVTLYLIKLEVPNTKGCFVPSLVEIGPGFLRRKFLKKVGA